MDEQAFTLLMGKLNDVDRRLYSIESKMDIRLSALEKADRTNWKLLMSLMTAAAAIGAGASKVIG